VNNLAKTNMGGWQRLLRYRAIWLTSQKADAMSPLCAVNPTQFRRLSRPQRHFVTVTDLVNI